MAKDLCLIFILFFFFFYHTCVTGVYGNTWCHREASFISGCDLNEFCSIRGVRVTTGDPSLGRWVPCIMCDISQAPNEPLSLAAFPQA